MKWIREHISKMPSFNYLNDHLSTIESMIETNPDLCIEVCKSMIESLCKTILTNQAVAYNTDWQFQTLVKLTLENMFTDELHKTDKIELIRRIASVVQKLGEMRNSSGFASHGQDKQHTPFDKTTALLTDIQNDRCNRRFYSARLYQFQQTQFTHPLRRLPVIQ